MNIKNSFIVLIGLFALTYGNIKDLTYPGYNRLHYYTEYQSSKLSHLDKIVAELPKHKDINIQTVKTLFLCNGRFTKFSITYSI